jgi:hypothetical protein
VNDWNCGTGDWITVTWLHAAAEINRNSNSRFILDLADIAATVAKELFE